MAGGLEKGIRGPYGKPTIRIMTNGKHKKSLSHRHKDNSISRPRRLEGELSSSLELLASLGV